MKGSNYDAQLVAKNKWIENLLNAVDFLEKEYLKHNEELPGNIKDLIEIPEDKA